jgi:hypothetical protein
MLYVLAQRDRNARISFVQKILSRDRTLHFHPPLLRGQAASAEIDPRHPKSERSDFHEVKNRSDQYGSLRREVKRSQNYVCHRRYPHRLIAWTRNVRQP